MLYYKIIDYIDYITMQSEYMDCKRFNIKYVIQKINKKIYIFIYINKLKY